MIDLGCDAPLAVAPLRPRRTTSEVECRLARLAVGALIGGLVLSFPRDSLGQTRVGAELEIHRAASTSLIRPAVAVADDGSFVVLWEDRENGLFGQSFQANGARRGEPFQVTSNHAPYGSANRQGRDDTAGVRWFPPAPRFRRSRPSRIAPSSEDVARASTTARSVDRGDPPNAARIDEGGDGGPSSCSSACATGATPSWRWRPPVVVVVYSGLPGWSHTLTLVILMVALALSTHKRLGGVSEGAD